MNKKCKMLLKSAFDTPKSRRKDDFLRNLNYPKAGSMDFIIGQIGYVRKRVWMMSILLIAAVILWLRYAGFNHVIDRMWLISSILPFVALVAVCEISQSISCNMAELEMGCKHSYAHVVLARLSILGFLNFAVFSVLLVLFIKKTDYGFIQLGYLFIPFMLTCTLSLAVLNYLKTREIIFTCGGISCFVSVLNMVLLSSGKILFNDKGSLFIGLVFFLLLILMIFQTMKFIKNTEESGWNSILIV